MAYTSDSIENTIKSLTLNGKTYPLGVQYADRADSMNVTAAVGSTKCPIYLKADGTFAQTTYSLGKTVPSTAVFTDTTYKLTLNSTTKGGGSTDLGTIYAPTSAGIQGQYLMSNGSGEPSWVNLPIIINNLDVNFLGVGAIRSKTTSSGQIGSISSESLCQYTDYVDISNYIGQNPVITYTRSIHTAAQSGIGIGLCFYDSNKVAISGEPLKGNGSTVGYELNTINVPTNAAYIRFSCLKQYIDIFSASITSNINTESNVSGRIYQLENRMSQVEQRILNLENILSSYIGA